MKNTDHSLLVFLDVEFVVVVVVVRCEQIDQVIPVQFQHVYGRLERVLRYVLFDQLVDGFERTRCHAWELLLL